MKYSLKQLVTAAQIKEWAEKKETVVHLAPGTIITPAAKDAAKDYGITLLEKSNLPKEEKPPSCENAPLSLAPPGVDPSLVARIVKEVMACLQRNQDFPYLIKESDPCGMVLVRGEPLFNAFLSAGDPRKSKTIKIFDKGEKERVSAGFSIVDDTSLSRELDCGEINYIIDGNLEIKVNNKSYHGQKGDVLFLPAGTKVAYKSHEGAKYLYVSCPGDCP